MSENGNVKEIRTSTSSENVEEKIPAIQKLTQEAINEEHKKFLAPLTNQLEKMIWLARGMVTTPHRSHYPETDYSIFSGTATHQPDNRRFINVYDNRCRIDPS